MNRRMKKYTFKIIGALTLIFTVYLTSKFTVIKILEENKNIYVGRKENIYSKKLPLNNFHPVNNNGRKGPITVDKELDDGKKVNIYDSILNLTDNKIESFLYSKETFKQLDEKIPKDERYLCETHTITPDNNQSYTVTCPLFYHIIIDKAYYGRYMRDYQHCSEDVNETALNKFRNLLTNCGKDRTDFVKNKCEGKNNCEIQVGRPTFEDTCKGYLKYLHLNYHCERDEEMKVPKIAIVMFANRIAVNSVYESAISELYQYANAHDYKFILNTKAYDEGRDIFYMKLHVLVEAVMEGLKTKEYDWIFWSDSDIVLINPNIKLETFLPVDGDINFIATADHNSLNAGLFFIKVNSWSLNFLMRAISYLFYHPEKPLTYADQTALNNVLIDFKEDAHYVIVPNWFNKYQGHRKPGDLLVHLAGQSDKLKVANTIREQINNNQDWIIAQTNKSLREEVLKYYNLPKKDQKKIWK